VVRFELPSLNLAQKLNQLLPRSTNRCSIEKRFLQLIAPVLGR